jgi:hypothetical protein
MRMFLAGAVALALAGCQSMQPSAPLVSQKSLYELRAGYDVILLGFQSYRELGDCPGTTKSTFAKPCAERAITRKMQQIDRTVQLAYAQAQYLQNDDNFAALKAAINLARSLLTQTQGAR